MSIATRIQSMEEHISNAYDSLSKFGIITSSNKNIENIANLINERYNNALRTQYVTGSNLTLENTRVGKIDFKDSDGIERIGLGVTSQQTYTGKNLLNLKNGTYTNNGITAVVNNGTITLNGTASANSFITIPISLTLYANQNYTISINNTQTIGGDKGTAYACTRLSTSNSDDTTSDVLFNTINNNINITKTEDATYTIFRVRTRNWISL